MKTLVADIGGTNARFAYQEKNNDDLTNFAYLKCSDFENIYDAIEHYQQKNNLDIENMSVAVASTTKKNDIKLVEKRFNKQDIKNASEAFITSATQFVMPVIKVDNIRVGQGNVGKYAYIFKDAYMEAIQLK